MTHHNRRVIVEPTAEQAAQVANSLIRAIICEAVGKRGLCRLALAGGTTPRPLYHQMAAMGASGDLPWRSVEVFFGDERDVPHDDVESNYRMAQRVLLDHLPIDPQHVYPMPADRHDLEAGAEEYERTIRNAVPEGPDGIPSFDAILLGIGGDGHTASLFPNSPGLDETKRLVVAHYVPVLGRKRMTFTFPLINAAENVIFFVTGDDKAAVIGDLLSNNKDLPASRVHPTRGTLIFVLDANAAKYQTVG